MQEEDVKRNKAVAQQPRVFEHILCQNDFRLRGRPTVPCTRGRTTSDIRCASVCQNWKKSAIKRRTSRVHRQQRFQIVISLSNSFPFCLCKMQNANFFPHCHLDSKRQHCTVERGSIQGWQPIVGLRCPAQCTVKPVAKWGELAIVLFLFLCFYLAILPSTCTLLGRRADWWSVIIWTSCSSLS